MVVRFPSLFSTKFNLKPRLDWVLKKALNLTDVLTSRSSNCDSNLSITAEIFCNSIELMALSKDLTTEPMFLATWNIRQPKSIHISILLCLIIYPFHGDGRLYSGSDRVDLSGHSQIIETFVFLSDGVFSVNSGSFDVSLLQSGLHLFLLSLLILFGLFGQSVQLFAAKFQLEQCV